MRNWKEIIKRQVEGILANKNHIYSSEQKYSYYETDNNKLVLRYGYTDFATIDCNTFSIEDTGYKEIVTSKIKIVLAKIKAKYIYETMDRILKEIQNDRKYDISVAEDNVSLVCDVFVLAEYYASTDEFFILTNKDDIVVNLFKSIVNNDVCYVEFVENIENTLSKLINKINGKKEFRSFKELIQEEQEKENLMYSDYEVIDIENDKEENSYFISINTPIFSLKLNKNTGMVYLDRIYSKLTMENLKNIEKDVNILENIYKKSKEYKMIKK